MKADLLISGLVIVFMVLAYGFVTGYAAGGAIGAVIGVALGLGVVVAIGRSKGSRA